MKIPEISSSEMMSSNLARQKLDRILGEKKEKLKQLGENYTRILELKAQGKSSIKESELREIRKQLLGLTTELEELETSINFEIRDLEGAEEKERQAQKEYDNYQEEAEKETDRILAMIELEVEERLKKEGVTVEQLADEIIRKESVDITETQSRNSIMERIIDLVKRKILNKRLAKRIAFGEDRYGMIWEVDETLKHLPHIIDSQTIQAVRNAIHSEAFRGWHVQEEIEKDEDRRSKRDRYIEILGNMPEEYIRSPLAFIQEPWAKYEHLESLIIRTFRLFGADNDKFLKKEEIRISDEERKIILKEWEPEEKVFVILDTDYKDKAELNIKQTDVSLEVSIKIHDQFYAMWADHLVIFLKIWFEKIGGRPTNVRMEENGNADGKTS